MEKFQNLVSNLLEARETYNPVFDFGFTVCVVLLVAGFLWLRRAYKRAEIETHIKDPQFDTHFKVLICDFHGSSWPLIGDLISLFNRGTASYSALQMECAKVIDATTKKHVPSEKITTFTYFKKIK